MTAIEWIVLLGFGVPIVVLCAMFVCMACALQKMEEKNANG